MSGVSSKGFGTLVAMASVLIAVVVTGHHAAQSNRTIPRFYPDDPIAADDDAAFDASAAAEVELSEAYDFLENTFRSPGDSTAVRAANVNTLDEVPDSSWFTNRIGVREMPIAEILRGPNKFAQLDAEEWTVVRGKGPSGFHPGFRAVHPADPQQVYQLEVDPPAHPQMASGAELIGTLIYHALGYHVVDVHSIRVDPAKIRISADATIRDASGTRKFTQADLDDILRVAARDATGKVYMSASRFEEGKNLGHFEYHGTRRDDPNDIHPHEHRRELRGNRVFSAWLAHDDSRAVNTLNMLIEANGRQHIRHYMYDFGAILGSATRFPDPVTTGHEYFLDKSASVRALSTLGLNPPEYVRAPHPRVPPSAGFFSSVAFDPERWKPNYPNPAFSNMRPDDAFWAARLVSRFSNEVLRAIVAHVGYDDASAADYIARTLIERRDRIARTWLAAVNPIVDVRLSPDGTLTFANAAVDAGASSAATEYALKWSRFANDTGTHTAVGPEQTTRPPRAKAPDTLLTETPYIAVSIRAEHPEHPAWRRPVDVYFRRDGGGWKTVGIFR